MARHEMSAADATWLHMDQPANLVGVNVVLLFDGPLDRDALLTLLRQRLVERFPRFRQRVIESRFPLGRPHWEDDPSFDLANHLKDVRLAPPGDEAALQVYVEEQMSVPIDRSKPLWEMQVLAGYEGGSAILARMHHCLADGIALARVLLSLTDEAPDAGFVPDVTGLSPARGGRLGAVVHEGFEVLIHPSRLVDLAQLAPGAAAALAKELFTGPDADTAFTGRNGVAKRAVWAPPVPLAELKDAAHAAGVTVNDVVLGAIAGALRRYLEERGGPVRDIRAMVPFNLRPLDEPLPRELGNRFGLIILTLPLATADRGERVAAVHRRMEAIKASPEAAVSYGVFGAVGITTPQLERRLVEFFTVKATCVLTNVPGPTRPVYLTGVPVSRVIGWGPRSGDQTFTISIFSYNGDVTVAFALDAGLVPDPERIIDAFVEEVDALTNVQTVA